MNPVVVMAVTTTEHTEGRVSTDHHPKQKSVEKNRTQSDYEFGGPVGVLLIILWSHYILLYLWYCLERNNGSLVLPLTKDDLVYHLNQFRTLFLAQGIPSMKTWLAYMSFAAMQLLLAAFMPGITMFGLPTQPDGKRLIYLCNGYSCYYTCILTFFTVHYMGIFDVTHICKEFGQYLTVSIIFGDATSLFWYFYGLYSTDPLNQVFHKTGLFIYDFFMGTILYPRLGIVDIKMVAEARWSWLTLILLTLSCGIQQYETTGKVSKEMMMMILAHWLYSNATVKGEHCIPSTWDMFHERLGWMLNFWNVTGVPFMYCFQSFYILKNNISISLPHAFMSYFLLLLGYYIFDSANAQKANSKIRIKRDLFPQVPWAYLENPKYLKTPKGNLLIDGWYAYARKMQYTGDIMMAFSWGLICGFNSILPYFYLTFFLLMILHRQSRDEVKCKEKYGEYWDQYVHIVPNVFLPSSLFYSMLVNEIKKVMGFQFKPCSHQD
mmetsp:Transcript_38100/g.38785  ORF Transcript_38100/g.38785 Transcript_38100/m.38785 type:complete len:492 (+) Transcript_38100:46-1521(+)